MTEPLRLEKRVFWRTVRIQHNIVKASKSVLDLLRSLSLSPSPSRCFLDFPQFSLIGQDFTSNCRYASEAEKIKHMCYLLSSNDPHQLIFYLTHILTLYLAFYLTSGTCRWGPAVPIEIWCSRHAALIKSRDPHLAGGEKQAEPDLLEWDSGWEKEPLKDFHIRALSTNFANFGCQDPKS